MILRPTRRKLLIGASAAIAMPYVSRAGSMSLLGVGTPPAAGGGGGGGPLLAHLAQGSTNNNSFTSNPINTTGATLIVIGLVWYGPNAASLTPTDSQSNTYTGMSKSSLTSMYSQLFYKYSPSTSASHTFTAGGVATTYPLMFVFAFNGTTGAAFDKENLASLGAVTSAQPGSVTPANNNEFIVSMLVDNGNPTADGAISVDSSLVQPDPSVGYNVTTAGHYGGTMAWYRQPTAGPINPIFSWTPASTAANAHIGTFQ